MRRVDLPARGTVLIFTVVACAASPAPAPSAAPPPPLAAPHADDAVPRPVNARGVPIGTRVVFAGDYDPGNFGQWRTLQARGWNDVARDYCTYSACVRNDGPEHPTAARFEVRDGDIPDFGGGERAEVRTGEGATAGAFVVEGDERWYEFSLKFDEDFPDPSGGTDGWFIAMQWHSGNGPPPLAVQVSNAGEVYLGGDGVPRGYHRTVGPVRRGVWVDYVLHVKFSRRASTGWAELWQDGVPAVPRHSRPTMTTQRNYLKQGIYRDPEETSTQVVWHDGLRVTAP